MIPILASYTNRPEQNAIAAEFVSMAVHGEPGLYQGYCSMSVVHDGKLVAATLFHGFVPSSGVIELSSASTDKRWLTKTVIRAMFGMAFDIIGAQLAVLRISERNTDMVEIARRFGFDMVLIPRLRGRDEAEWICTLTDDQWRSSKYAPNT